MVLVSAGWARSGGEKVEVHRVIHNTSKHLDGALPAATLFSFCLNPFPERKNFRKESTPMWQTRCMSRQIASQKAHRAHN
jgi:hypothetical protein